VRRLTAPSENGRSVPDGLEEISPNVDPLTGLHNWQHFAERISSLIGLVVANDCSFAVVVIDIDRFKPIVDLYGRSAGDQILQQVGSRLQAVMGFDCTVARIGADEFGVIIPSVENEAEIGERLRQVVATVSAPYDIRNRTARLTASVGCSLFRPYADTAESVLNKARMALYHARRKEPGHFTLYSAEMEQAVKTSTRIEQALRRAVESDELEPHFQPIVDLKSRRIIGFEALARWTDPDIGVVTPAIFIPIAEERRFIGELAQNILRKAVLAARNWPSDIYLSFNLSPSQLADYSTVEQIKGILGSTGFDPGRLEVEITETGLTTDPCLAARIIEELGDHGMRIALDDFGTGQSSLGRLRDFRFDKLKIDRSFISSMLDDPPSQHIVKAIVALCDALRLGVIAEGIEQEEQASLLMELGCTEGQGFLFGAAIDAASAWELVAAPEDALSNT